MSIFFLIPLIPFVGGLLTLIYHFKNENTNILTNMFIFISFIVSLILIFRINQPTILYELPFFSINSLDLTIKLQIDNLSIVMLLLINFISFIIHRYATNYLESDITQGRFMAQLSILTAAVSLLVISGNLLTAFIGWQFVGLALYILLNHYHYDVNANKSAKKKFIINRIGDLGFLTAVVLCYVYFGNSDFNLINSANDIKLNFFSYAFSLNTLIVCLIFVAVMTKSAQFPFHIWLPDTMQAPTPVSAIMHGGVINSGGFLLARISQMVNLSDFSSNFIFTIGMLTVFSAAFFMLSQSDVKKQLAYSTMGQMGFMIVQCSIGLYTAAVFHLIAHGFFKVFLFLGAGDNLKFTPRGSQKSNVAYGVLSLITSVFMLYIYYQYVISINSLSSAYLISAIFICMTLSQLFSEILKLEEQLFIKFLFLLFVSGMFAGYIYLGHSLDHIISGSVTNDIIKLDTYKLVISLLAFLIQCLIWVIPIYIRQIPAYFNLKLYHLSRNKLFIEEFYRKVFLIPYRVFGDLLNNALFKGKLGKAILTILTLLSLTFSIIGFTQGINYYSLMIVLINQIIFFILMASANRALDIRSFNIYILVSQFNLVNMGLFVSKSFQSNVAIFQVINSILIFISIELIIRRQRHNFIHKTTRSNSLAISALYFTVLLFLWIGVPGTASFVSEINLVYVLAQSNVVMAFFAALGFIMLAIAIMHTLQDHVFSLKSSFLSVNVSLSKIEHTVIISCILVNFFNGIHPAWLLGKLGWL